MQPEMESLHIVIAGGGTGGHLYPGLALADEIKRQAPDAKITFIGSKQGLESTLVPAAGYRLVQLSIGRGSPLNIRKPANSFLFLKSLWECRRFFQAEPPHAVVGLGGFAASVPGILAGLGGKPLVLLEQNAIPGRVTRFLSRWADELHLQFSEAADFFAGRSVAIKDSGSPPRRDIVSLFAAGKPDLPARQSLLIMGGSQGAERLNQLVREAAPRLVDAGVQITHVTGPRDHASCVSAYESLGNRIRAIAYADDVASLLSEARLAVVRAGASTMMELALAGLPAILVPFPFARDDHQTANAKSAEQCGGGSLIQERDLTAARLADEVISLWNNNEKLSKMSDGMRSLARPDAGNEIAASVLALARLRKR